MSAEALESGLRKLAYYAWGYYSPEYIHLTQDEAKALLQGLEKLGDAFTQR